MNIPVATACPACEAANIRDYAALIVRKVTLAECEVCQTVFVNPLPTARDARAVHNDRYDGATGHYFSKVEKKMHRSRGRMWWLQFFAGRGRRLLDVGCNGGFLVEAARERGLEAHGIDIDPVSIDYARAHYPRNTFYCGTVEYQKENLGVFDLIYCSEVIEHVPQAHAFAHSLASVLKPGGFIYLTTPDIHHLRRPKNVNSWNAISDPGHYIFYSRRGLRQLFRSVGIDWVFRFPDPKPGLRVLLKKWK